MRTELFPEIEPYESDMIALGDGHEMYWEESGNRTGTPIVFLHGGPGAGTMPVHRRFFDPGYFRIVLCDQRGSGRSTPSASVVNTTPPAIQNGALVLNRSKTLPYSSGASTRTSPANDCWTPMNMPRSLCGTSRDSKAAKHGKVNAMPIGWNASTKASDPKDTTKGISKKNVAK